MIKVTQKIGLTNLEMEGDIATIAADALMILRSVYKAIKNDSEKAGEHFKEFVTSSIKDGIVFRPDDELQKEADEKLDELKGLLETLAEILSK